MFLGLGLTLSGVGSGSGPRTQNVALWSQDFSNGAWNKSGTTVTADTVAAPDGTTTGDHLVIGAVSGNGVFQLITLPGMIYTLSAYIRSDTPSQVVRLKYYNGAIDIFGVDVTATASWQRTTLTVTGTGVAGNVGIINSGAVAATVDAWGFQINTGSFAGPYVATTTAPAYG